MELQLLRAKLANLHKEVMYRLNNVGAPQTVMSVCHATVLSVCHVLSELTCCLTAAPLISK